MTTSTPTVSRGFWAEAWRRFCRKPLALTALVFVALLPTVAPRDERIADRGVFFRVWARKEAVLKQLGLGKLCTGGHD
jgi:hypothetical protein